MEAEKNIIEKDNTSGKGKNARVPESILREFNWGACLGTWIWGIGNNSYKTLLIIPIAFIFPLASVSKSFPIFPFIKPLPLGYFDLFGLIVFIACLIWFGKNGNEWAWKNKRFRDLEQFTKKQRTWAVAGIVIFIVFIFFILLMIIISGFFDTLFNLYRNR